MIDAPPHRLPTPPDVTPSDTTDDAQDRQPGGLLSDVLLPNGQLTDALPVPPAGAEEEFLAVPQDDDFYSPKDSGLPPLECMGCGWCCLDNPCEVSHAAFGYTPRCPALVWTGARYICDLVVRPVAGVDLTPLFVGQGCCARHNAWRESVRERG